MHLITEMNTKKCRSQLLNFIKKTMIKPFLLFVYVTVSPIFTSFSTMHDVAVSSIIFTMPRSMAGENPQDLPSSVSESAFRMFDADGSGKLHLGVEDHHLGCIYTACK